MEKLELGETYKYMVEARYVFDKAICNHKFFIEDIEFSQYRFEENVSALKSDKEVKDWGVVLYDVNHNILKEKHNER